MGCVQVCVHIMCMYVCACYLLCIGVGKGGDMCARTYMGVGESYVRRSVFSL